MLRSLGRGVALASSWISEVVLRLIGRRRPYGILKLRLSGDLPEQLTPLRLPWLGSRSRDDYMSLLALLRWARDDVQLRGVLIHCDSLGIGWAKVQEIRRSLQALRDAGKRVWVYAAQAGIHEYLLASVAERVILAPSGTLDITGLSSEVTFFAGALQKLGVDAEVVQLGKYKSAAETFTRSDMSAAHREMLESLVGDLYDQVVEAVAQGRGLDAARARELLDGGPFLAQEALRQGLVDAVQYEDQAEEDLRRKLHEVAVIERSAYFPRRAGAARRTALRQHCPTIGMLQVAGTIKMGESIPGPDGVNATGIDSLARDLEALRDHDEVRAVVVRVTSPGGSGLASDLLWRELQRIRQRKPLVVSFGDVAASGGYYIGVAGSPVLAEGGTITGSIGVLAGKAVLRRLYDRVGVTKEMVTHGRHAGLHSDYVPLDDAERQLLRSQAEHFYSDFVAKVAAGRSLAESSVEAVAQGRVWTGRQALRLGLIDQLGGLERAVEEAKVLIGLSRTDPVVLVSYPKPRRLWRLPFQLGLPQGRVSLLQPWLQLVVSERIWTWLPMRIRFF
jgi:protease-4